MERVDLERVLLRASADPALGGMPVGIETEGSKTEDASSRVVVEGDVHLLERALRNLLSNAAEAERSAGREGPLEVVLTRLESYVEVTIRDRGRGLPEGDPAQLLDPFVSHREGGVGLGLALAQRIVKLHRGSLRLERRAEGGAEARIRLPAPRDRHDGRDHVTRPPATHDSL